MTYATATDYIEDACASVQERLCLNDIKKTIWLIRPDLRELFAGDRTKFDWWLLLNGAREYKAIAENEITISQDLLTEPAPEALPQVRPTLTRFMRLVWSMRPDVQQAFDLNTHKGQTGFVWWYFIHGANELNLARFFTEAQRQELNTPDPRITDSGILPLTRVMGEIWRRRPDLQRTFNLKEPQERDHFVAWYFVRGATEYGLVQLIDERQANVLLSPVVTWPKVPLILSMIWMADENLHARFPDLSGEDFRLWLFGEEGQVAYPVLRHLMGLRVCQRPASLSAQRLPDRQFGVNLIGYVRGQLGLGEDVRMAALACQAANIPFSVYNVEPGRDVCQKDDSFADHISDKLPYAINIFCMTGIETARLAAVEGSKLFDGRLSIGYWPWELPDWPEEWCHAYQLVDEVWASSRFTYETFVRSCPKPVRHMPMAVTVEPTSGLTRRNFSLPENRFIFIYSFDFLSSLTRKNPQACVKAFRMAFSNGDEPVGLVVKAMRATSDNPLWQEVVVEAEADRRITIITSTLGRAELLDLYRVCDCFVSLHRSEGFGRGIAEAMMLGKPVIVTGHSGNLDFTVPGTAALVDHRPRRVVEGDYPFGKGQVWAEPDIGQAAWWMQRIAGDSATRDRFARSGQQLITSTYNPAIVGATYAAVLGALTKARALAAAS